MGKGTNIGWIGCRATCAVEAMLSSWMATAHTSFLAEIRNRESNVFEQGGFLAGPLSRCGRRAVGTYSTAKACWIASSRVDDLKSCVFCWCLLASRSAWQDAREKSG